MSLDISGPNDAPLSISPRLIKELKDTLRTGQIVQGVVKGVLSDNKYVLQINGVNTVGHTDIPLEEGQTFFAGVKDIQDRVILNLLSENDQLTFLQEDLVKRIQLILSQMNLSSDELAIKAAIEFLKNGLPLDKENFMTFLQFIRNEGILSDSDLKTAVLLFKNDLPVHKDLIEWIKDFFKDFNFDEVLRSIGKGEREVMNLNGVVQNVQNILSGLKDVLAGRTGADLDIQGMQNFISTLIMKGSDQATMLEKEFLHLMQNSGLNFENKIKDTFMRILLGQEDFVTSLKDALKILERTGAESLSGSGKAVIFNYSGFSEAFSSLKSLGSDLSAFLKDMSFEEIRGALVSTEFQGQSSQLKEATYFFLDRIFLFFRELQRSLGISGEKPAALPDSLKSLVQQLMRTADPFLSQQDRNFLKLFLDQQAGAKDVRMQADISRDAVEKQGQDTGRSLYSDLKSMLFRLVSHLDTLSRSMKQETVPGDPLSRELTNASQFSRENIAEIIREQVNLRQNMPDFQDIHITVPFMEGRQMRELNVYFRRESAAGKKGDKKSFTSVVIFLELSQIGPIRVDVRMQGKALECFFYSPDEKVIARINEESFQLEESFRELQMEAVLKAEVRESLFEEKQKGSQKEESLKEEIFHKIDIKI
ncbi:MAG: hypothetical protein JW928_06560 [Candidatus Aureabacteria bacterium]|nr:hypothetical protein [Candidatus Auribacterota bacterium]